MQDAGKARASNTGYYHDALKSHFGPLQPAEITTPFVKQYWAKRKNTPTSLREELLELRVALTWAHRQGWIPMPPYIDVPNKRPPRERFLTREEAAKLIDAAKTLHFRLWLLLAMTTGHRKGAILGLTWDRVDLDRSLIDFTDPERYETRKRRTVAPVGPEIVAALRDALPWKHDNCPNVIQYHGKPVADIKHAFKDAAEAAGVPWATPHILKHSVISWMAEDGDDVETISDLTATHPNTVRRVYRKFSPDRLRTSAERLSKIASLRPQGRKPPSQEAVSK